MKVLHILYSGLGGPYNVVETLSSKSTNKIKNYKLYVGPKLNKNIKLNEDRKNSFYVKTIKFFSQFFFVGVLKKILGIAPNLIILHNFQILACCIAKIFLRTKIIYVDHNSINSKTYKDYIVLLFSKFIVNHYICLNLDNKKYLINKIGINKKNISFIKNGIPINNLISKKNNKKFKIGMAGRINDKKLHSLIINTIIDLNNQDHNIFCHFVGDGESKFKLQKELKKNKVKQIFFDGYLSSTKLSQWYKKLDLYVHASKGEGCSIAILESISNGTPFIGSNVSGIKNLKFSNKKNLLFKNNTNALKKTLLKFKNLSIKKRRKFLLSQRNSIINYYQDVDMIKNYENLYYKLSNPEKY